MLVEGEKRSSSLRQNEPLECGDLSQALLSGACRRNAVKAAKRRNNVARGVSPGESTCERSSPERGRILRQILIRHTIMSPFQSLSANSARQPRSGVGAPARGFNPWAPHADRHPRPASVSVHIATGKSNVFYWPGVINTPGQDIMSTQLVPDGRTFLLLPPCRSPHCDRTPGNLR